MLIFFFFFCICLFVIFHEAHSTRFTHAYLFRLNYNYTVILDVEILSEEGQLAEEKLIEELREAQDAIIEGGEDAIPGFSVQEDMTRENMNEVTNERVYYVSCPV